MWTNQHASAYHFKETIFAFEKPEQLGFQK